LLLAGSKKKTKVPNTKAPTVSRKERQQNGLQKDTYLKKKPTIRQIAIMKPFKTMIKKIKTREGKE